MLTIKKVSVLEEVLGSYTTVEIVLLAGIHKGQVSSSLQGVHHLLTHSYLRAI